MSAIQCLKERTLHVKQWFQNVVSETQILMENSYVSFMICTLILIYKFNNIFLIKKNHIIKTKPNYYILCFCASVLVHIECNL